MATAYTPFPVTVLGLDKEVLSRDVGMIIAPGEKGDLGILANHLGVMTPLKQGNIRLLDETGQSLKALAIEKGYLMMKENHCTILLHGEGYKLLNSQTSV